jgi:hypothetical protein
MPQDKWKRANIALYIMSFVLLTSSACLANKYVADIRKLWIVLIEKGEYQYYWIKVFLIHVHWVWFTSVACISIFTIGFLTFTVHNKKSFVASCIILAISFGFNVIALLFVLLDEVRITTTL